MPYLPRLITRSRVLCFSFLATSLLSQRAIDAAPIFDVADDFSIASNPNGAWSYGFASSLGGPFTRFTNKTTGLFNPNFRAWGHNVEFHPFVAYNSAATNQQGSGLNLDAGTIGFHPGRGFPGLFGVIRWTSPSAGDFDVAAAFQGRDPRGTTTDVHILLNDVSLLDGVINRAFGPGSGPSYSDILSLNAGDTIDFVVGNGGNNFFNDSTGLDATITAIEPEIVPEPAGFAVWMTLLLTIAAASFYMRQQHQQA